MNDEDRRQWVLNDEGLYGLQQSSGLGVKDYVRRNRDLIDGVVNAITSGRKPAHYLVYHHGQDCPCAFCRRRT